MSPLGLLLTLGLVEAALFVPPLLVCRAACRRAAKDDGGVDSGPDPGGGDIVTSQRSCRDRDVWVFASILGFNWNLESNPAVKKRVHSGMHHSQWKSSAQSFANSPLFFWSSDHLRMASASAEPTDPLLVVAIMLLFSNVLSDDAGEV